MLINEIILHNEYVEIKVKGKNYIHSVLLDTEDLSKVGKVKISNTGYAYQSKNGGQSVARVVMNIEKFSTKNPIVPDHINGNTLDNRKINLSIGTQSINCRNRHSFTRNNTGIVGIQYRQNRNYKYFRVSLTNNEGKRQTKQFNINKLGRDTAFKLAKEYLDIQKPLLNYK